LRRPRLRLGGLVSRPGFGCSAGGCFLATSRPRSASARSSSPRLALPSPSEVALRSGGWFAPCCPACWRPSPW